MDDKHQINFEAPATLLKWPSIKNKRTKNAIGPYTILDGTLDDCIQKVIAKPSSTHHLYEIHTAPQGDLIGAVLSETSFREIARLREFHQLLQARRNSC
jgi:hypothetical protein